MKPQSFMLPYLKYVLVCMILLGVGQVSAQTFKLHENYEFKEARDYVRAEEAVIESIEWLAKTPVNKEVETRKEVSAFVLKWAQGTSKLSLDLGSYTSSFSKKNPEMLVAFISGCARLALYGSDRTISKLEMNKAGVDEVIKVYQLGGAKKDKNIEKLISMKKDGGLDEWLQKRIN